MLVFVDDSDTVQTVEADEGICSGNTSFRKFDCYFCTVTKFNFFLSWLLFTKVQCCGCLVWGADGGKIKPLESCEYIISLSESFEFQLHCLSEFSVFT